MKGAKTAGRDSVRSGRDRGRTEDDTTPRRIEWFVGAVSAFVVLAMIGFVVYEALSGTSPAPQLSVTLTGIERSGNVFRADFLAVNMGEQTAAGVTVKGSLHRAGEMLEAREVELDYIPSLSERRGGLLFQNDPRRYELRLEVEGYREP